METVMAVRVSRVLVHPLLSVTVRVGTKIPWKVYVCGGGFWAVDVDPSPKSHAHETMLDPAGYTVDKSL